MAVSSIKCCWVKFSARIRDYLDVVDSYYRPNNENLNSTGGHRSRAKDYNNRNKSNHHHHHACNVENKHNQVQHVQRSQLPPGFSKKKTSEGQVYFVDASGNTHWYDPSVPKELLSASLNLDSLVGRLSSAWEIRQTQSGKAYYVNHTKQTTQFTDPRLVYYKDYLMSALKHIQWTGPNPPASITLSPSGRHYNGTSSLLSNVNPEQSSTKNCTKCSHHNPTRNNTILSSGHGSVGANSRRKLCSGTFDRNYAQLNQHHLSSMLRGSHHNLSITNNHSTSGRTSHGTGLQATSANGLMKQQLSGSNGIGDCANRPDLTMSQSEWHYNNRTTASTNNSSLSPSANMINSDPKQATQTKSKKEMLYDKISILRQELLKQQVLSHPCRIDVSRKRIFEESFRIISQMQPSDLKRRLLIKFRGEEGLDYGGVAREWFYLLSREILNPIHGLFQYTSDDIYNLQINPDSGIVYREHLSYLNFSGRVIGMAVFHGHFIEGHFTLPFYKMLLKKAITLEDIEHVDPDLYRSLCWILENDITNVIDTTFLVQHNAFGQLQEHELKKNGRNVVVTESNKHEYVSLYVNYRCRRGIEKQFEALQRGFNELISGSLLKDFEEDELELLIGGLSKINIDDWRLHTKLKNCSVDSALVKWFWDIVKSYKEDKRARLLQFVTGSPRVPIQGFKALQGVNSELRLFTIHLIKNACTDDLPKSHTCFNRIDLPPYESYEKLRDKLTQAIEETMGFAIQ